jgi:hypothetical protein
MKNKVSKALKKIDWSSFNSEAVKSQYVTKTQIVNNKRVISFEKPNLVAVSKKNI